MHFSTKDIQNLAPAIQYSPCLHTLYMDNCGMNGSTMIALFKALHQTTIQRLFISCNLTAESHERSDTIAALIDLLNKSDTLESLSLCGDDKTYLGEAIIPLFKALDSNSVLKRLEAFGNRYGDVGASYIGEMLAVNDTLESIDVDDGCISLTGFKALLSGITKNSSVKLYRFPDMDIERLRKASGKDWDDEKTAIMDVIQSIGEKVKKNRLGEREDDDEEEDYFMSVSKLPNSSSFRDISSGDEKVSPKSGMISKMARTASRKGKRNKMGGNLFAAKKIKEDNEKVANVQVNVSKVFSQQPRRTRGDTVVDWKMSLDIKDVVDKGEFLQESLMEDGISISTTFDGSPPRMPVPSLVIEDDDSDDEKEKEE
eukprot:TRINITY_DN972_c0_g1_i2.p1 TRINITY_DN972_c0_g1~~TRINITY_DN972_c0_g1_i2.p1  ORF type:complete len:371 (+),score=114.54 TRINITY_DN972_c0_g1_i2:1-1113(+)